MSFCNIVFSPSFDNPHFHGNFEKLQTADNQQKPLSDFPNRNVRETPLTAVSKDFTMQKAQNQA